MLKKETYLICQISVPDKSALHVATYFKIMSTSVAFGF